METFITFAPLNQAQQMRYFETRFLEEANEFIAGLDSKTIKKSLLQH